MGSDGLGVTARALALLLALALALALLMALALALLLALSSTKPADYTNHRARQENGEDADFRHHAQALPESRFSASH